MKAFFFGAGCSYGTLQNYNACPTSETFGEYLEHSNGWRDYGNLRQVAEYLGYKDKTLSKINLEDLWSFIDHYAKFGGFLPSRKSWSQNDAICELKRAILRLCGSACEKTVRRIPKTSPCTIIKILKQVEPGDVIVSFNWDTLVERLAKKFFTSNWTLIHCDGLPSKKQVKFAKPHGSVSWRVGCPEPFILPCKPVLEPIKEAQVRPGYPRSEPLPLGAVPLKSELVSEVQAAYGASDVFQLIMKQWRAVLDAVRDADTIVVLGYRFPKEDEYGRFFFKEGMRQRQRGKPLTQIECYSKGRKHGIRDVFGRTPRIQWKGPVTAVP